MLIKVSKIASITMNLNLSEEVEIEEEVEPEEGNVLVVKALGEKTVYDTIELVSGRMAKILEGDIIAGALGERRALRGFAGKIPKEIEVGDVLNILNLGGTIGLCTSENKDVGDPLRVQVLGSISIDGRKANIRQNAIEWRNELTHSMPIVMVSGTCMNSGKTYAACEIIKYLTLRGYRIAAAKVTGIALMRDTLNMRDHGAKEALSFVNAGLPSTTNIENVAPSTKGIIYELNKLDLDFIVVELGDGILGGYGVGMILKDPEIMKFTKVHVMCANDPVGAWGAMQIFEGNYGLRIDIMSGPTTDNEVGTEFSEKDLDIPAANARTDGKRLAELVERKLFE